MILDEVESDARQTAGNRGATLDALLAGIAQQRPDALALADPPNRSTFTDGAPRRLSFARAHRMATAIASRLQRMDLPANTVVAIQLPNIVENVLAILGVLRAGMIAAPLPLLWRRADMVAALSSVGAKALITCGRVGAFAHAQLAMAVAAEVFSIRYLCGFGPAQPDGVVPFDDLFDAEAPEALPLRERNGPGDAAARVAAITFEVTAAGIIPIARSHAELDAGARAVMPEGEDGNIISTLAPASFAGLCLTLVSWLRSGSALSLHHPFDRRILAGQLHADAPCSALVLPGPVAFDLAAAGTFRRHPPGCVLAAWHAPSGLASSETWREPDIGLLDVAVFGEIGLVAAQRNGTGRPTRIPYGPIVAPRGAAGAIVVGEIAQSSRGTMTFGGPMAPRGAFPLGADRDGTAMHGIGADGAVDTGYHCRVDPDSKTVVITATPAGVVEIGGCRLALRGLQDNVVRIESGATLEVVPDSLLGQRLIGRATTPDKLQAALEAAGVHPLAVAAFRTCNDAALRENA
jgi:hypothetical protein